jgi:Lrp/AsnC family transcriptional regulator
MSVNPVSLDHFDVQLLDLLQQDASLSTAELAETIGLSQSPCWRRIHRLEEAGIIDRRVTLLNRKALGLNAHIFAQVKLSAHGRSHLQDFTDTVRDIPEILDCFVLMGDVDFLLRIVTRDVEAYEKLFFEKLSQLPGVQEIKSSVALSEIKHTTALPLPAQTRKI